MAVFVLATLLCVVAIEVIIRAFERIGGSIHHSQWGLIVMTGVLFVNIGISTWENYWAKKLDSNLLYADARHTFSDVVVTIGVIIGWQVAARGFPIVDFVLAIFVALFVFYLAFQLFRKSIPILVDESAVDPNAVIDAMQKLPGVIKIKRLRSRVIGNETYADIVVLVTPEMSTEDSHDIAELVEKELLEKFNIHDAVVHIEPR